MTSTLLPANVAALVDKIAALRGSHNWWVTPQGRLRTRGNNLDPLAAYYERALGKAATLSKFVEQGNALGLTDEEALLFAQACDREAPPTPESKALRELLLTKLIA